MKGDQVLAIGLQQALAGAALIKEAHPSQNVPGVRADAVEGTNANARALAEKAIEVEVVGPVIAEEERNPVDELDAITIITGSARKIDGRIAHLRGLDGNRRVCEMEMGHRHPRGQDEGHAPGGAVDRI